MPEAFASPTPWSACRAVVRLAVIFVAALSMLVSSGLGEDNAATGGLPLVEDFKPIPPPPPDAAKHGAASSEAPLPANPATPGSDQPLLPDEILVPPVKPVTPGSSAETPAQPVVPFKLEIEPVLPTLPPDLAGGGGSLATTLHVHVKGFRFEGNHVFSNRALQKVVAKYAGRDLTTEKLEEARQALTLTYVHAGYVNSGAVLPDQDLKGGIVVFKIVEGRLSEVQVQGNWWYRTWWLRHVLRLSAGQPLNFDKLKTGLQLLRQNPNLRQINAELEPGGLPGESILKATVKENQPFRLALDFDNKRPPSVGAEIVNIHAQDLNLTGHDDPLSLTWGIAHTTSDTLDRWEYSGAQNLSGAYEFPVSPWRTTMELHASKSDAAIVEDPFNTLNIKSKSEQYGGMLRQPFYQTLNQLIDGSFMAERRTSQTFLLQQPFDLSPGSINGKTQIFVLRFALEYVNRSQVHVLALRSTVNWGVDAFDPTLQHQIAPSGAGQFQQRIPDGLFVSWLGQAQYVRRLFNTDTLAVLRLNAQLSNDPLVSLEQFSLGGMDSVRGYRENQLLRDNGAFASLEVRVPILRDKEKNPLVALAPFFDFGAGWDTVDFVGPRPPSGQIDDQSATLYSTGIGLLVTPNKHVNAQIYWGYALNRKYVVEGGKNLQDYGLHFAITVSAF